MLLFTLLHDNETKAVQYCCVAKERNNVVVVHCYVAGHRRHDATETITRNSVIHNMAQYLFTEATYCNGAG
jgi:hypothetical protein